MVVTVAAERDLPAVERLYRAVIEEMHGTPHDVWWEFGVHPTREGLRASASRGELIVARDGAPATVGDGEVPPQEASLLGACVVDGAQDAGYRTAAWPLSVPDHEVAVLHLLAVAPEGRGRGVARRLVAAAARAARARGARVLRLDVFDNNAPAIALYRSCGFTDLGARAFAYDEGFTHGAHLMELDLGLPGALDRMETTR
ncbi:GNAT family N-acetyltransferase [Collinsella intestinalis]|uniref:GNAT family N-acetyltransferase n=1 Tax=Collinsella intestinalis TaxID=147207 RepID=UPI0025A39BD7|nr:GNAT family N-acetyltransferase [Collinsella intestinalis]MDM8163044.1 GNAT family N-acetyltransferase [Collinsella intestinalis]